MDARITVVTLGVSDLARSRRFYVEGLGWAASSSSSGDIVFIDAGGVVLALYPRALLAADARVDDGGGGGGGGGGSGFGGITLAQNVRSPQDVDAALLAASRAGATILKPAEKAFWGGYSGYFADPDGHPWEVAHNPHWTLDDEGRVECP
jgi:hypothetical protein